MGQILGSNHPNGDFLVGFDGALVSAKVFPVEFSSKLKATTESSEGDAGGSSGHPSRRRRRKGYASLPQPVACEPVLGLIQSAGDVWSCVWGSKFELAQCLSTHSALGCIWSSCPDVYAS